ncbi:BrnA antitoxin family protein [Chamaesiphon sp.]|uniref:BrnA antitoxin family protein n=1 Tax=Chamaesiphon sp. TaxID=2814140 RepID=UPI0035940CCF
MNKNDSKNTSGTNWEALAAMSDDTIDYSDIPPLTAEFFERATLRIPASQAQNLVHLDPDVMKWFQSQGVQPTEMINTVLRRYIRPLA